MKIEEIKGLPVYEQNVLLLLCQIQNLLAALVKNTEEIAAVGRE